MSAKQSQGLAKTAESPKKGTEDVGALIYREIQLRKTEAAVAASERKQTSTASTHRRTSTRKRSPVASQGKEPLPSPQRKSASKRKRDSSMEEDHTRKKVAKKKKRGKCSADGCTNGAVRGGVCVRHGAKVKRCNSEGCTNQAQKGGVCIKHGAKVEYKRCSSEGCTKYAQKGGVCWKHGAKDLMKE